MINNQSNIQYKQLKLILKNNTFSSFGNFIIALFLTIVVSIFNQPLEMYLWLSYMTVISLIRYFLGLNIQKKLFEKNCYKLFDYQLFSMVVLTAIGWGILPILLFNYENQFVNAYIIITLAGMVAGSITSLTPIKRYFYSFVLVSLVPLILILLSYGEIEKTLFSLVVLIFAAFVLKNGKVFNEHLLENFQLNLQNRDLIKNLKVQTQEAENANRLKSQFLTNMSHEIRTPMNGILGFIDILKELEQDTQKLKYLNIIKNSSEDLLSIINDILDFSKIESDKVIIKQSNHNIQTEIQRSITLYEHRAQQKFQKIQTFGLEKLPKYLKFDALRFHQIMNNILANAVKFSPINTFIEVFAEYDKSTEQLKIRIKDQGIGISKDKQKDIFKPFIQEDSSVTRQYDGTGLGLSISHRLVDLMGGEIGVSSEHGLGSEFYFSIYAPIIEKLDVIIPKSIPILDTFKGHILVVEDNLVNQKLICALLHKFGLTFDIANDGLEAIEAFDKAQYDLILMDQNMPNMSGTEACKLIRKQEETLNLNPTPIVALTANAMEGDRQQFLDSGMNEYLTKPIKLDLLKNMFENFLKKS